MQQHPQIGLHQQKIEMTSNENDYLYTAIDKNMPEMHFIK